MKLTDKQELAVNLTLKRYQDGHKYTIIAGYARNAAKVRV